MISYLYHLSFNGSINNLVYSFKKDLKTESVYKYMDPMIVLKESVFLLDKHIINSLLSQIYAEKILFYSLNREQGFYFLKNSGSNFLDSFKFILKKEINKIENVFDKSLIPNYFFDYSSTDILLFKDNLELNNDFANLKIETNSFLFCISRIEYEKYNSFSSSVLYSSKIKKLV